MPSRSLQIPPEMTWPKPADWLPPEPAKSIFVRHTIGFGDPITSDDIPPDERLDDGFPQSLEEHIVQSGVRYFKLKISPTSIKRCRGWCGSRSFARNILQPTIS